MSSLSNYGKVVLTTKGNPSAFLIKTNDKILARLYEMLHDAEFVQNMEDMQKLSKKNGNSKMGIKKINALIAEARKSA